MDEEATLICIYKEYAVKHFGKDYNLASLCVPHFNPTAYNDTTDNLAKLEMYLTDLRHFCKVLSKAARLRQQHYERFINGKRTEDVGHRHWRIAMNDIATNAQLKLDIWTKCRDEELDEAIRKFNQEPLPLIFCITTRLHNPEKGVVTKQNPKKTVKIPPLSKAEKKRRKRERQRATDELLDKAVKEADIRQQQVVDGMRSRFTITSEKYVNVRLQPFVCYIIHQAQVNKSFVYVSKELNRIESVSYENINPDQWCYHLISIILEHGNSLIRETSREVVHFQRTLVSFAAMSEALKMNCGIYLMALFRFLEKVNIDRFICCAVAPLLGNVKLEALHKMIGISKFSRNSAKLIFDVYYYGVYVATEYILHNALVLLDANGVKKITNDEFKTFYLKVFIDIKPRRGTVNYQGYKISDPPRELVERVKELQERLKLMQKK